MKKLSFLITSTAAKSTLAKHAPSSHQRYTIPDKTDNPAAPLQLVRNSVVVAIGRPEQALQHGALDDGIFEGPAPQSQEPADEPLRGERVVVLEAEHFGGKPGHGG